MGLTLQVLKLLSAILTNYPLTQSLYPDPWLVKPLNSFNNPNAQIILQEPLNINYTS